MSIEKLLVLSFIWVRKSYFAKISATSALSKAVKRPFHSKGHILTPEPQMLQWPSLAYPRVCVNGPVGITGVLVPGVIVLHWPSGLSVEAAVFCRYV